MLCPITVVVQLLSLLLVERIPDLPAKTSECGFGLDMSLEPVEDLEDRRLLRPSDCPDTDDAVLLQPKLADTGLESL